MLDTLHALDKTRLAFELVQPAKWWGLGMGVPGYTGDKAYPGAQPPVVPSSIAAPSPNEMPPHTVSLPELAPYLDGKLRMSCERIDRAEMPEQAIACLIDAIESTLSPTTVSVALSAETCGICQGLLMHKHAHGPLRKLLLSEPDNDLAANDEPRDRLDPSVFSEVLPDIDASPNHRPTDVPEVLLLTLGKHEGISGLVLIVASPSHPITDQGMRLIQWPLMHVEGTLHRLYVERAQDRLEAQIARMSGELARMQERVIQAERLASIGELVSGVAHELNNPLTSVIGYSQLILQSDAPDDIRPDLLIVDSEAQRCQRIVGNLLSLARQDTLELSAVCLNDLVQRTLELKAYPLRVDNITVELDLAPNLAHAWVNACQMQQVLLNLVGNAHEAMSHANSRGVLTMSTRCIVKEGSQPMVRLTISDDGPGVAPENRELIFESFFSTKRDRQGTGLGLPISRRIVRDLGGELWLDTETHQGACFVIDLPVYDHVAHQCPQGPLPTVTLVPGRGRVLIVDDEVDIVSLLERTLKRAGYTVSTASDGYDAERLLYVDQYDLVLLDLKIPGIDGRALYDTMRLTQVNAQAVFVTGDLANPHTAAWLNNTGCPVIEKPFDIMRVTDIVRQTLDARRYHHP